MDRIITIGREFGSGGHEIGLKLAEALHVPFYDKLLVSMVAEEGEFAQEYLDEMDEKVDVHIAPFLATRSSYSVYQQPMSDRIFFRQAEIIRKLADDGPCVIVGRCADYVLAERENVIRIFIYGDLEDRIARKGKMLEMDGDALRKHVNETDKKRARYYRHYTGLKWGEKENYDLCINTSCTGIDGAVRAICAFIESYPPASESEEKK
jgi:cytidylate kinase